MVQTDISQLSGECSTWRANLRSYREEFTQDKVRLQQAAGHTLPKDRMQDVEHLQNQFHIQLINIHQQQSHNRVVNQAILYTITATTKRYMQPNRHSK